jgi:selenocysteine lyase/cysteine desulfurase
MNSIEDIAIVVKSISGRKVSEIAGDENFWLKIRSGYRLKPGFINLENGYYNIIPEYILSRFIDHAKEINYEGSYYMRTVQFENKKRLASQLADLTGCPADELIITRNTTESLDMIIGGLDWKPGDEAVIAEQDYPCMLDMFTQISKRYGVINKTISIPNHPTTDEEIVNLYEKAITKRTRLLMVCHMINITGQILPVRKISDMAHKKGVLSMIDGAHTIGHIKFTIPELGGDFFGSSLHKWLSVPLGAGLLWIKKDKIKNIWPVFAPENHHNEDDIIRLNHTGTHPVHTDLTIVDAIDFYNTIGAERKEARLRYLQQYWTSRVRNRPGIILNTPEDPHRSCGIANVGIRGMKPDDLSNILFKKYCIYCAPVDIANVHGCRITPNIFTTTDELDALVKALTELT